MVKEYGRRLLIAFVGIAFCGLGCALGVFAGDAGTNSWGTLALGLGSRTGLSFGTASFCVSLVIVVIDLLGRGKLGFGSLLNVIFVAWFSDFFLGVLSVFPAPRNQVDGLICTLSGQCILAFATLWYMSPGLGCGPRDTLMVLIGKKLPRIPIGVVRFSIEAVALATGLLLGAPFGVGTVLVMVFQSSLFQLACRATGIDPRNIVHEDFAMTFRRLAGKDTPPPVQQAAARPAPARQKKRR